jgi:hypothetical protein
MAGPPLPGLPANDKPANSTDRANIVVTGTIVAVGAGKAMPVWGPMNLQVYGVQSEALTVVANSANATVPLGTTQAVGDSVQSTLVPPGTTVGTTNGSGALTLKFPTQTWWCVVDGSATLKFPAGIPVGLQGSTQGNPTLASLVGATIASPDGYFGTGVTVLGIGADGVSLQLSSPPNVVPQNSQPVPIEFALTANCITASGTDAAATFVGSTTGLGAATTTLIVERSLDGGKTWVGCNLGGSGALAIFTNLANPLSLAFGEPEAGSLYRLNCTAFAAATRVTINYRWSASGQAGMVLQTPAIM